MGSNAATPASESTNAESVVVVTYHNTAKVAAQVARIETACPDQMMAMARFQCPGSGCPFAFTSPPSRIISSLLESALSLSVFMAASPFLS